MFGGRNFALFVTVKDTEPNGILPSPLIQAGPGQDVVSNVNFEGGNSTSMSASFFVNSSSTEGGGESLASVFINQELFETFRNQTPESELIRLIFVAYDAASSLFQDSDRSVKSIILSVLQSPLQGDAPQNLVDPVKLTFQTRKVPVCKWLQNLSEYSM